MFNGADAVRPVAIAFDRHHVVQTDDAQRSGVYNVQSAVQKAFFPVTLELRFHTRTEIVA